MTFEWDSAKAESNRRKHGATFEEAESSFNDPKILIFNDLEHSESEERQIAIGISNRGRLLIISYTVRGRNVRIMSARRATKAEARNYG